MAPILDTTSIVLKHGTWVIYLIYIKIAGYNHILGFCCKKYNFSNIKLFAKNLLTDDYNVVSLSVLNRERKKYITYELFYLIYLYRVAWHGNVSRSNTKV